MAPAPRKPCLHYGCPELVPYGYCIDHKPAAKYERQQHKRSSHSRGYGAAWRKVRSQVLLRDRICVAGWTCGGRHLANHCDHIIPKELGGLDTMDNLRGLCSGCHTFRHVCDTKGIELPPYETFNIP